MNANRLITRRRVSYLRLTCLKGRCWATWIGSGDRTLVEGQSLEIRNARRVCIQLLGSAEVDMDEERPAPADLGTEMVNRAPRVTPVSTARVHP